MGRRIGTVVAVVATLCLAFVSPANARAAGPVTKLAGTMTGTTTWQGGTGSCMFVDQTFDATYTGGPGSGTITLHIHGCVSLVVPSVGTFDITTRHGTLTGTFTGSTSIVRDVVFDFDLAPTSGTRAFNHATATLRFLAQWEIGDPAGSPFSAVVTV